MRPLLTDLRGNPIYSFAQRRLRRMRHLHQSTLVFLVQSRAWEDVVRRARKHPDEVLLQDDATGNTPLHVACRLDPPVAVIRILKDTSRVKNREGATPLHIAASHRCSAESLGVLIECARQEPPEDVNGDKQISPTADLSRMGRAPIHYACMSFRGLELDAFRLLFEATLKEGNLVVAPEKHFGLEEFINEEFDDDEMFQPDEDNVTDKIEVNVLGMKDATGHTPLALLFRRYRERVKVVIRTVDRLHREHHGTPNKAALAAAMTVHADLGQLWEKARWIVARLTEERIQREGDQDQRQLRQQGLQSPAEVAVAQEAASWAAERLQPASSGQLIDSGFLPAIKGHEAVASKGVDKVPATGAIPEKTRRRFRIVHASVGLTGYGCPPEMIRLAISLHPNQVREMDEDGNLPIHIAVEASSYLSSAGEACPNTMAAAAAAAADASDDLSVLSEALSFFSSATVSQTTNPFDKVIKILLQHYPDAARVPQGRTGRLPLVLAVESGRRTWEDGIRTLMNAYPPALHNKKLIDASLYPNVLALVTRHNQDPDALVLLDGLLRPPATPRNKRLRQEAGARTTLFELLRANPDWITLGYDPVENKAIARS